MGDVEITILDHIISQNGQKTVNIERLPSQLQKSKLDAPPTVQDLQREIGRLRQEIAFYQEAQKALLASFEGSREAYRLLRDTLEAVVLHQDLGRAFMSLAYSARKAGTVIQQSLRHTSEQLATSEGHLLRSLGISLDDSSTKDYTIL
ncbi:hypothetical protein BDV36DRAFT_306159 [Aspergillus pseudocaelatus]|uniref:Uncharacterized protein n=1 Tax=Aspergillus pseudocaelatus TaxID=1825620 RepID=A0ABQ6X2X4_9EURO|nr:hypothetical protein BDV36DRAFT_306159 [Aspergillus pseudocaelatus]